MESKDWYQRGVKAGKTDGWMNLEETLSEDLERHPDIAGAEELVRTGMEGWEQTDHFTLLYGSEIMGDAQSEVGEDGDFDEAIEKYQKYKDEFWEGYLTGRGKIGRDIHKMAADLIRKGKTGTRNRKPKAIARGGKTGNQSKGQSGIRGLRR